MTLTKADIRRNIQSEFGIIKKESTELVETLLGLTKETLENGEDLMISGFGKFCINEKNERRGRNPATGGTMMLKPRKVVTFKRSGKLRIKINGIITQ